MAKQGMKRPDITHTKPQNQAAAVPEIQGKAKHGLVSANPIIAGTHAQALKPHPANARVEKEISNIYPVIDTDLARDNIENDMTAADLQDL